MSQTPIEKLLSQTDEGRLEMVLAVVDLLLEDVADEPDRLKRARELARRDIAPLLARSHVEQPKGYHFESDYSGILPREKIVFDAARSTALQTNAAPQVGAGSSADPATKNGEPAAAAPIPEEFAVIANFYDAHNMTELVRTMDEHITSLQAKLPPTPPFPGINRVREG